MNNTDEPKLVLDPDRIAKAKADRFQLSARILTGDKIKVQVVNDPYLQANADFNTATKVLRLNEAFPVKVADAAQELVYDRGKLFHEVGHALYTDRKGTLRGKLMDKTKNPDLFLTVSGLLEDGRIERKLKQEYQGVAPYLDSLTAASTDAKSHDIINGLALRVRHGMWRNKEEADFWQPFEKQISAAVAAEHTDVPVQVGYDIVEALNGIPPQPNYQPTPINGNGENEGISPSDSESEQESDKDSDKQSEGKVNVTYSGSGGDKTTLEQARDITENALAMVGDEAADEWSGILDEVISDPVQEHPNAAESAIKEQLTPIFRDILTEMARTRFSETREGILNTLALPRILTSKRIFKTKEEGKGKPHVALLLDTSGSMSGHMPRLTRAGRILNGALRDAGIETKVILFGANTPDEIAEMPVLPTYSLGAYGGTPTGKAMEAANNWFESVGATKPLMIIVTDGAPNNREQAIAEKAKLNDANGYLVGIVLEHEHDANYRRIYADHYRQRDAMFDTSVSTLDIDSLPSLLEPMILDYISS